MNRPLTVSPAIILPDYVSPRPQGDAEASLHAACREHPDLARFERLGASEEGRPLCGIVLGGGPKRVSLIAGNHADEPVGPETLRTFVTEGLRRRDELAGLFERFRFVIVPHTNPDGAARNRSWIEAWPDLDAYLAERVREQPGRDLEFGFPDLRKENRLTADFLHAEAPDEGYALHMSLHGMGFAEGAQLLIERRWTYRTEALQEDFRTAAEAAGLSMHDHNRQGEKGFFYVAPGFTTTPEGAAMRAYFRARGDEETAARFRDSSMEFVRSLGGDPLCLVTELPLFVVEGDEAHPPGVPAAYLRLKEQLAAGAPDAAALQERFGLRPLPLRTAMQLQLQALGLGLKTVDDGRSTTGDREV